MNICKIKPPEIRLIFYLLYIRFKAWLDECVKSMKSSAMAISTDFLVKSFSHRPLQCFIAFLIAFLIGSSVIRHVVEFVDKQSIPAQVSKGKYIFFFSSLIIEVMFVCILFLHNEEYCARQLI